MIHEFVYLYFHLVHIFTVFVAKQVVLKAWTGFLHLCWLTFFMTHVCAGIEDSSNNLRNPRSACPAPVVRDVPIFDTVSTHFPASFKHHEVKNNL